MTTGLGTFDDFPRTILAHAPTPIEKMENLTAHLGGPALWVKRDDCTGLAFGGNKARQIEFYFGEAQAQGADTVLITGAVQSNFVRTVAAAAAKLGMDCHVQLEERVKGVDDTYRTSGNVLLDRVLGAHIHSYPDGEDEVGADRALGAIADDLKAQGRKPYIIPLSPGHPPLGAFGYVVAARELLAQMATEGLDFAEVVLASGSTSTHAGMLHGLRALGSDLPVLGVCVRRSAELQAPRVKARCDDIAELLGTETCVTEADVRVTDVALAPGYGQLNTMTLEALELAAQKEGLVLDPVYTGKVFAGMVHWVRDGAYGDGDNVLFLHTGGQPALFAYEPKLAAHWAEAAE